MTVEMVEVLRALSDVMGVDFNNAEDVEMNSCCGVGTLHDTKEECQTACDKWNKLADLMGWGKYEVYKYNDIKNTFVCANEERAEEFGYTKVVS